MRHYMRLQDDPFKKIQAGTKTFELRLYDEKIKQVRVCDESEFENLETGEKLVVRVVSLHIIANFEELYAPLPLLKCGYSVEAAGNAHYSDMEKYYSLREQKDYGVIGIEVQCC